MLFKQKNSNLFGSNTVIDINRNIKLKSITIKISKNYIKITMPFFITNKNINDLLKKKFNWIKKQLLIQQDIQPLINKEYTDNEKFKFLGKDYKLNIIKGIRYSVKIENDLLVVVVKDTENIIKIKRLIQKWFNEKSLLYFQEKTFLYAKKNNLEFSSIKVRNYKARWGSCSINGDIAFNWRLIMAPPKIIEYVIIHELVHLIEHNHSPRYWEQVKKIYPDIDQAKNWLISNGKTLNI